MNGSGSHAVDQDQNTPRPGIRHLVSTNYAYIVPSGYVFFHDPLSGRVGLTYYHDEIRIVAEALDEQEQGKAQYATQPFRVQDATVIMSEDDYLRNIRTTLEGIEEAKPGLLNKYGISLNAPQETK